MGSSVVQLLERHCKIAIAFEFTREYPTILKIPTSFFKMSLKTLIFRFQFSTSLSFIAQILLVG